MGQLNHIVILNNVYRDGGLMKMSKKVLLVTIGLMLISVGTSWCLFKDYKGKPSYVVNTYMRALNKKDYKLAASLFYEDERLQNFNDIEMAQYLSHYFESKGFMKMEEGRGQIGEQTGEKEKAFYEVRYNFADQNVTSTLGVVKVEDQWQVVFPFKIEDVNIYTPFGSTVWFDNQQVTQKEANKYVVKNVLPGQYELRITFPNNICQDYTAAIEVPDQTEIKLPYPTVDVAIETIPGMVVELQGEKQESSKGIVNFNQVLEGNYSLKVYDNQGNFVPYEAEVVISDQNKQLAVTDMQLSKLGHERLKESIQAFYSAYIKGIQEHTSKPLEKYVVEENRHTIMESFQEWFIDYKDIQKAQIEVELEQVQVNAQGDVEAKILEIVHLTNKEQNEKEKIQEVDYKIMLNWIVQFKVQGQEYQVKDRLLKESLISYKDNNDKWVTY